MITPPDPFAQSFDSIEIARAPSPAAIDSAFAAIAPDALLAVSAAAPDDGRPGFFLLDDAEGRFVVDREMGVVTLRDEALLTRERGVVYPARLRVVESSGASYDLDLKLRITGQVPQVLGSEDFGFGAETLAGVAPMIEATPSAQQAPSVPWTTFAAVSGLHTKAALNAQGAYGALLVAVLPATSERVSIAFGEALPAVAPASAIWSH
jgi:hypothetical protein